MTSIETEYLKELDYTYSKNRAQGYRGDKKNTREKVPIGTIHSVNLYHSEPPSHFI